MPSLINPRHEHFAQLVAAGETPTKAYALAGYSEKGAHASANRLLQDATVRARVEELTAAVAERAVEKAALNRSWVLGKLRENVERAMQEQAVTDREGNATGEYTYQGSVANRALELIGKELGMFVERTESKTEITTYQPERLAALTDDELNSLSDLARKLAATGGTRAGAAETVTQ